MYTDAEIMKHFTNHIATYNVINDRLSILEWGEPHSSFYYVRYVFDGRNLYISGDLGCAVFRLTWNGSPHSFHNVGIEYFHEKLEAFCEDSKYDFDSKTAVESIVDYFKEYDEDGYFSTLMNNLLKDVDSCDSEKEWADIINDKYSDELYDFDFNYWEWIYAVGRVIPSRIHAYLIGLKMASAQLKNMEENKYV